MPSYLDAVRKKFEKQGFSEEEVNAKIAEIKAKEEENKANAAVGTGSTGEEKDLRKIILKQGADIHGWEVKYKELEREFGILKSQGASHEDCETKYAALEVEYNKVLDRLEKTFADKSSEVNLTEGGPEVPDFAKD